MQNGAEKSGKDFYPGIAQPSRRPDRVSLRDAMPGGVGAWTRTGLQTNYMPSDRGNWTEEEIRRAMFLVLTPGMGHEPIHIGIVYGIAGAVNDAAKLEASENLLRKDFAEIDAIGDAPGFLVGDFNIEPARALIVADGLISIRSVR